MKEAIGSDPVFSPAEFVAVFNQSLEMMYPSVVISGELANFRINKGAWVYFDVKDEDASVKFFGTVYKLPGPLEDGLHVEVRGYPRLHPKFGFNVNVESIRAVGEGSIKKAQDLLFKKLQMEGLFAPERKRQLPYPPRRIGLVTSAESAAISDFCKIIAARWPRLEIDLTDTLVQGGSAPASLVKAIEGFNQLSRPPDVLVIIRGGGSADDLAAFSEESVVRAIAASRIPTLVAIGHERDISLAELAADQRASTPSNAAELLVPDRISEKQRLASLQKQMDTAILAKYEALQADVTDLGKALQMAVQARYTSELDSLATRSEILRLLNPQLPLKRGYSLVRGQTGKVIRLTSQVKPRDKLHIHVSDGQFTAKVE